VITLDTSAIVALLNRSDSHHADAARALASRGGPTVVPLGILSEVDHVLSSTLGPQASVAFLLGLEQGDSLLDPGDGDIPRIRELLARYAELRLAYADAAVVACAERNGGRILTFDPRPFEVVARDVPISLVPSDG
jgi:predicted nucleic acid-binding protein